MAKYCLDDSKSEYEVYTKEELDEIFLLKPDVYSGTSEPSSDIGNDGDIYLKIEE